MKFVLHLLIFYLFLFPFTLIFSQGSPTTAVFSVKSGQLLSKHYEFGVLEISSPDPLYFIRSAVCPSRDHCPESREQETCVCDFTNPTCCGCGVGQGCSTTDSPSCESKGEENYCEEKDWTKLELDGEEENGSLLQGEYEYFRFVLTKPCTAVWLDVQAIYGDADLYISQSERHPSTSKFDWTAKGFGGGYRLLCPVKEFEVVFGPGTYFVSVYALTTTKFALSAKTVEVLEEVTEKAEFQKDCEDFKGVRCLFDGQTMTVTGTTEDYFHFQYVLPVGEDCFSIGISAIGFRSDLDTDFIFGAEPALEESWDRANWRVGSEEGYAMRLCNVEPQSRVLSIGITWWTSHKGEPGFLMVDSRGPFFQDLLSSRKPYQLPYDLLNALILECASGVYICEDFLGGCMEMWPGYPSEEQIPVWPLPAALKFDPSFFNIRTADIKLTPKNNSYVHYFLLQAESPHGGVVKEYGPGPNILNECTFKMGLTVVTEDGEPVEVKNVSQKAQGECVYEEYVEFNYQLDLLFDQLQTPHRAGIVDQTRFLIDCLLFVSVWEDCLAYVGQFLESEIKTTRLNGKSCIKENKNSSENGCCGWNFESGCCLSADYEVSWNQTGHTKRQLIEEKAANADCTESYLQDISKQLNVINDLSQEVCSKVVQSAQDLFNESKSVYRECGLKYLGDVHFKGLTCEKDADCQIDEDSITQSYRCNLKNKTCLIPAQSMEQGIIKCILNNIDPYVVEEIKMAVNFETENISELAMEVWEQVQDKNCATDFGHPLFKRDHYYLLDWWGGCLEGCEDSYCVDPTCSVSSSCLSDEADDIPWFCESQLCYNPFSPCAYFSWARELSTQEKCETEKFCNWKNCSGESDCEKTCLETTTTEGEGGAGGGGGEYFCGYCEDGKNCILIPEITTEEECLKTKICPVPSSDPNSTSLTLLTQGENSESCGGRCTEKCLGKSCESSERAKYLIICFNNFKSNNCTWYSELNICIFEQFNNNELLCLANSLKVQKCSSLSIEECQACQDQSSSSLSSSSTRCPVAQEYLQCFVDIYRDCETEKDCLENSGFCTDRNLLLAWNGSEPVWGRCVFNYAYKIGEAGTLCPVVFHAFYFGCLDFNSTIYSKHECEVLHGGRWVATATSEQECIGHGYGCIETDVEYPGLAPKQNCEVCGAQRADWFTWERGEWISNPVRQLEWKKKAYELESEWRDTMNYTKLFHLIFDSVTQSIVDARANEIFCRVNSLRRLIETVLCDTSGDAFDCFVEHETIMAGSGRPCQIKDLVIIAPPSEVTFRSWSLESSSVCSKVDIFQVPLYELAHQNTQRTFGLSFIPKNNEKWILLNKKNAFIGVFIATGISIEPASDFVDVQVCINIDPLTREQYPQFDQYDFADRENPLNLEVKLHDNKQLCANISRLYGNETQVLIPILRTSSNWEEQSPISFGESCSLIIVSCLYFLMSLESLVLFFFAFNSDSPFQRYHKSVVSFLIFSIGIVRGVYFILLGTDKIDIENGVLQNTLVQLPTFLYYSCLAMTTLAWASVYQSGKKLVDFSIVLRRYILIFYIPINIFLYVSLAVLIWLFDTLNSPSSSECGSRVLVVDDDSGEVVVIVYEVFFVGIAFFLLLILLFFGRGLSETLKKIAAQRQELNIILSVYVVSIMCTAIFFLCYVEIDEPTPDAVWVLLFVELLPLCFVVSWMLFSPKIEAPVSKSTCAPDTLYSSQTL